MNYICNPVNINYRYQFNKDPQDGTIRIARESADPSMIFYQGHYYIFSSMTLGVWSSDDLVKWENHRLPDELPLYDYAPDVRVIDDYVYFCASNKNHACDYYRTKDVINGPYEKIEGSFPFWDPNMFEDEDGRVYFYWGCSAITPIYGVELDKETLLPKGEPQELIFGDALHKGYERDGENHSIVPASDEAIEEKYQKFLVERNLKEEEIPNEYIPMIKGMFSRRPYVEGAWMTKYNGVYYLQYAVTGAQYNVYSDGVYVSDKPLGSFKPALNNPYSYKPGGFLPGAGHGSTMQDKYGNWWHSATMRISMNHTFERRVGLWPAGFDEDGELFCNQRYGDWPMKVEQGLFDPWKEPDWYLLSYQKSARASTNAEGYSATNALDENVQTWWKAASPKAGEWLEVDLEECMTVHTIQVNFADDKLDIPVPGEIRGTTQARYIDDSHMVTRWKLEISEDGQNYQEVVNKLEADTDYSHDMYVHEQGLQARYIRLTVGEVPYHQAACISGLRIFGKGNAQAPQMAIYKAKRDNKFDMTITIENGQKDTIGYVILWGHKPDKLYHSYMTFKDSQTIGALVEGQEYYVRVDSFNENGICHGQVQKLN